MTDSHALPIEYDAPFTGRVLLPAFRAQHARRSGAVTLRYTRSDEPGNGKPVVVVLGGISANADIIRRPDGEPGWWAAQVGAGLGIDTNRFHVIGLDYVTGRQIAGADCRSITTVDQANLLAGLLNALNLRRVHAVVGASYGAMVGLAFAARYPDRLERLIAISGAHVAHPRAIAVRAIQRRIIRLAERASDVDAGVSLARALALTTYREHEDFRSRRGGDPQRGTNGFRFPVEDWLDRHADHYAEHVSAEDYLQLSESLDLHEIDPAGIVAPVTLVAAEPDYLVPTSQLRELVSLLRGPSHLHVLHGSCGHDAFLKDKLRIADILRGALSEGGCHD